MERHFEGDLEKLKMRLLRMGGLAEQAVHLSMQSLLDDDASMAERVVREEDAINQMQMEIDEMVVRVLALHQLMAIDLRFVLAVSRINADLERIGDQAVNIAESALQITRYPQGKPYIDLPRMSQLAEEMTRDSLNALVAGDRELARSVLQRDDTVDALRDQILRELLTYMMGNAAVVIPPSSSYRLRRISSASPITRPISPKMSFMWSPAKTSATGRWNTAELIKQTG